MGNDRRALSTSAHRALEWWVTHRRPHLLQNLEGAALFIETSTVGILVKSTVDKAFHELGLPWRQLVRDVGLPGAVRDILGETAGSEPSGADSAYTSGEAVPAIAGPKRGER